MATPKTLRDFCLSSLKSNNSELNQAKFLSIVPLSIIRSFVLDAIDTQAHTIFTETHLYFEWTTLELLEIIGRDSLCTSELNMLVAVEKYCLRKDVDFSLFKPHIRLNLMSTKEILLNVPHELFSEKELLQAMKECQNVLDHQVKPHHRMKGNEKYISLEPEQDPDDWDTHLRLDTAAGANRIIKFQTLDRMLLKSVKVAVPRARMVDGTKIEVRIEDNDLNEIIFSKCFDISRHDIGKHPCGPGNATFGLNLTQLIPDVNYSIHLVIRTRDENTSRFSQANNSNFGCLLIREDGRIRKEEVYFEGLTCLI